MSDVPNSLVATEVTYKLTRVVGERTRVEGVLATRCALLERITYDHAWPAGDSLKMLRGNDEVDVTGATLPDVATLLDEIALLKKTEAYLTYAALGFSRGEVNHVKPPDLQALSAELTHAQEQAATVTDARRHGDEWRQRSAAIVPLV